MDDERAERIYRWTIRSLYVTAIALNLYLLWDQVKDSPEVGEMKARFEIQKNRIFAPMRARKTLRKESAKVYFEAMTIVEEAAAGAPD